MQNIAFV